MTPSEESQPQRPDIDLPVAKRAFPMETLFSSRPSKKGEPITEAEIRRINSGELKMFVYGKITYMDCPHWTKRCR